MKRITFASSSLVAVGLTMGAFAATDAASPTAACINHPDMTLPDYLARAHDEKMFDGGTKKALPPGDYRLFVPKGLVIENGPARYAVSQYTVDAKAIPDEAGVFRSEAFKRYEYEFTSPCRVQDSRGKWWVVDRQSDGLQYFAPGDAETEAEAYRPSSQANPFDFPDMSTRAKGPCAPAGKTFKALVAWSGDFRRWRDADFRKTPRDLESVNDAQEYATTAPVMPRILPDGTAWPLRELPEGTGIVSACRVRAPDGMFWAAYRDKRGILGYVPMSALRPGPGKDLGGAAPWRPDPRKNADARHVQQPDASPEGQSACVSSAVSLADMTARSGDRRRWQDADFKKAPGGQAIENGTKKYAVKIPVATVRVLPSGTAWPLDVLLGDEVVTSPCRVKDSDGQQWASYRDRDGFMVYLSMSDLAPRDEPPRPK